MVVVGFSVLKKEKKEHTSIGGCAPLVSFFYLGYVHDSWVKVLTAQADPQALQVGGDDTLVLPGVCP